MDYFKYSLETCTNFPLIGSYCNQLNSNVQPPEDEPAVSTQTIGFLGVSALAILGAAYTAYYRYTQRLEANTVRVGSYNILDPRLAVNWKQVEGLTDEGKSCDTNHLSRCVYQKNWKQYSNWNTRKYDVAKNILKADLVCLQEVTQNTLNELSELTGYAIGPEVYMDRGSIEESFGNAIVFNPKKVEWIKNGTPTSIPFNLRRAATGFFKACGKTLQVTSVHLLGYNTKSQKKFDLDTRNEGDSELNEYINKSKAYARQSQANVHIVAGDLNECPTDSTENNIRQRRYRRIDLLMNANMNLNGSELVTEPGKDRRIDWIASEQNVSLTRTDMELEKQQTQASDHLMTGVKFEFKAVDSNPPADSGLNIQNTKNKFLELVDRAWRYLTVHTGPKISEPEIEEKFD